ncbi:prolipoprotein diacylglyceryl transferase [Acetivibrio cellulolyticus]|uniref:prolipoprotein diacylglyceryl transferase n=1 Tax=Acetivibrio cellulolyticus TaxID=35830 RepID=UPI0001E2EC02|nr:prolipoprotein diacylglyceryl transferase family protein [Acetivibrio cellulolyticus]
METETMGLKPVLFYIGGIPVEAYPVFMLLALITGFVIFKTQLRRDNIRKSNALYIAIFAIAGGAIGSKLPIIFMYWNELNSTPNSIKVLLSGRTIVGGLIGGAVGTFLAKKMFRITERMGNQIAIPVAAGMAVGRLGCLFRGCCYGQPTNLPWGMDFGDHITRHPTQIYEMIFDILLVFFLRWKKNKGVEPGELFKIFLNCYLSFRFLLEFIRVEKISLIGLTDFQLLCVISLIYINRHFIFKFLNGKVVRDV